MEAILELAESQHRLGIPFERVTIRTRKLPVVMAEGLKRWVVTVDRTCITRCICILDIFVLRTRDLNYVLYCTAYVFLEVAL